ncbi:MAG: RecQ family ATP-dependent DNA helicase [Roseibacillus sp.]|nr:RecQ family ATP-dependent DNA helicase [Roseibacillus sp.]
MAQALEKHFGFSSFRDGQRPVIESILANRPTLAVFPTGGGKSLCYQLPAVLLEGLTVVVSPLIALMKDQVDALVSHGVAAARLDSSLSVEQAQTVQAEILSGRLKLLYVAPERLANENFRNHLKRVDISLLAVDEAHCISEWGHNFRPDYLKLSHFARELKISRILALTATATPAVAGDIRKNFGIAEQDHIQLSFHRPNLELHVTPCLEEEKRPIVLERLRANPEAPTIIYVTRQETAEGLAAFLKREGLPARPYHAGLRDETRSACQEAFMSGDAPIITATIAFGMGIDKADIRRIIHYNLPKSLENYTQETGRAGRDGRRACCELLACKDDLLVLENFVYGDTPSQEAVGRVLEQILMRGTTFDLSRYDLAVSNDIRPLVINTLLTYLELEGYIVTTSSFYSSYRVRLLRDIKQINLGLEESKREFIARILSNGKQGRKWVTIEPTVAAEQMQCDRDQIIRELSSLETHGDISLKPAGIRHSYRRLRSPERMQELSSRVQQLFLKSEEQDLYRLEQVLSYAEESTCLNRHLLNHFGENQPDPCGHCGTCLGSSGGEVPGACAPEITLEHAEIIQSLLDERHGPLRTARQLARFLCGLSSPATSNTWVAMSTTGKRIRLTTHDAFALLQDHPFHNVLTYCSSLIIP